MSRGLIAGLTAAGLFFAMNTGLDMAYGRDIWWLTNTGLSLGLGLLAFVIFR